MAHFKKKLEYIESSPKFPRYPSIKILVKNLVPTRVYRPLLRWH